VANRSGAVLTLNHDSCFVRNGSGTQARALKVSDLTGATGNRCGSNRHREKSAGAGVRLPGRVAECSCRCSSRRCDYFRSDAAANTNYYPPPYYAPPPW
jgi:hypothetical protein